MHDPYDKGIGIYNFVGWGRTSGNNLDTGTSTGSIKGANSGANLSNLKNSFPPNLKAITALNKSCHTTT